MKVNDLLNVLNTIAPFKDSESWDNTGLLIGDRSDIVRGIMTTLDVTEEVVDEAISKNVNAILAHHPIIFSKIKTITDDAESMLVKKIIKNDINVIALHTNLDFQSDGVSAMIAETIGLKNHKILIPQVEKDMKLRVNVPEEEIESFKEKLVKIGFGKQGDYEECFYQYPVKGQFKPLSSAEPYIGQSDILEYVDEYVLETIFNGNMDMVRQMVDAHPYEEVAYDLIEIKKPVEKGLGVYANFNGTLENLVSNIEKILGRKVHSVVKGHEEKIKKVSIIGGSGASYIKEAMKKSDCLITGDIKYHEALDAKRDGFIIIDAGHHLEYLMISGLKQLLEKEVDVEVVETTVITDPFER
ncbi:Nif3-like dinuclear metal center hexameric protein [Phocicoccus pinnipedialis]|uniref:GTP cyclohydrolase 1 type 2 homolog n=1 Tax=Phocicoccus pinnipedialis TaxID=110845 RepID=A0A6V7RFQ2_9BACL|nr:Nif3-like dinuclear metal center hexameric protein [Jeotgalicoccus pinnipedialis]MBP1939280.1 dinuclear metal center YbgI/SA1388 family protein [Jeotgalicoccus pinnipedialis]CAD2076049.1 Putative GTP cyclohydrolase 1 type 2 [Jeotgalicoccus pinnipedialis]